MNDAVIKAKSDKPVCISFNLMIQDVEYKNINTWDDQRYKKMGNDLYTKSKYTNERWTKSSASRTGRYFFLATDGYRPKRYC